VVKNRKVLGEWGGRTRETRVRRKGDFRRDFWKKERLLLTDHRIKTAGSGERGLSERAKGKEDVGNV